MFHAINRERDESIHLKELESDGVFNFMLINSNEYLLGTNETQYERGRGNAFLNDVEVPETLIIPDYFNDKKVTEIGQYAFTKCYNIIKLIIGNNIKIIHTKAFADLNNVKTIIIPSSLEILLYGSIYFWNSSSQPVSNGKVQVIFQENSKLNFIDHNFAQKDTLEIISPSILSPKCNGTLGSSVNHFHLYSFYSFKLCNLHFRGCKTLPDDRIFLLKHFYFIYTLIFIFKKWNKQKAYKSQQFKSSFISYAYEFLYQIPSNAFLYYFLLKNNDIINHAIFNKLRSI